MFIPDYLCESIVYLINNVTNEAYINVKIFAKTMQK